MARLGVVLEDELGAGNEVTLAAREQLPPINVRLNLVAGPHMSGVCLEFVGIDYQPLQNVQIGHLKGL